MGAFDEIIAAHGNGGGAKTTPPPASPGIVQSLKDWWLRQFTAQQEGWPGYSNRFFQDRRTKVPGVIEQPSTAGARGEFTELPANKLVAERLRVGPPTDMDTARGLVQLQQEWAQRAKANPREGTITISPNSDQDRSAYAHETAHSLFNQIGLSAERQKSLGDEAARRDLFMPLYTESQRPENRATEAVAYTLDSPKPQGPGNGQRAFLESVTSGGGPAADKLKQLYGQRMADVGYGAR